MEYTFVNVCISSLFHTFHHCMSNETVTQIMEMWELICGFKVVA